MARIIGEGKEPVLFIKSLCPGVEGVHFHGANSDFCGKILRSPQGVD